MHTGVTYYKHMYHVSKQSLRIVTINARYDLLLCSYTHIHAQLDQYIGNCYTLEFMQLITYNKIFTGRYNDK